MKKKRGSHVGTVISFTIFIGFLIFLYVVIEPAVQTKKGKESLLNNLQTELLENATIDVVVSSVYINESFTTNKNCIKTRLVKNETGRSSIVKSSSNNPIGSAVELPDMLNIKYEGDFFFKVYHSYYNFNEYNLLETSDCYLAEEGSNYSIGLVKKFSYLSEGKILELIELYSENYEKLKEDLNIPAGSEFSFSLTYENESKIGFEYPEISTEVYIKSLIMQFIDKDANIEFGALEISVW